MLQKEYPQTQVPDGFHLMPKIYSESVLNRIKTSGTE